MELDSSRFISALKIMKERFLSPSEKRRIAAFELRYHPNKTSLPYREIGTHFGVAGDRARILTREGERLFRQTLRECSNAILPAIPNRTLQTIENLRRGPLYLVLDKYRRTKLFVSKEELNPERNQLTGLLLHSDLTVTQMTEEEISRFFTESE